MSEAARPELNAVDEGAHQNASTVLVVDDERTNRMVLTAVLTKEGYRVVDAEDGRKGVELFEALRPDLVLMDIMMPGMDGYEAARQIKRLSAERFTPIIFLTALTDEHALARCVEAGGDDFLTKPYNRTILRAKMESMMRLRRLYGTLSDHKEVLGRHNDRLEREHAIAERVFANVLKPDRLEGFGIRHLLAPVSTANGDVVFAARRPDGGCNYMIGDFTGHGLAAAVGAMPASDLFRRMSERSCRAGEIATALNRRFQAILPTGLFLAACVVSCERDGTVEVWNGGIPDALFFGPDGLRGRVPSSHLPLGVLGSEAFDSSIESLSVPADTRLILYSDGAVESHGPDGDRFGQERLEAVLGEAEHGKRFDELTGSLAQFREGAVQEDDITIVEIDCGRMFSRAEEQGELWSIDLQFGTPAVRDTDPVAHVVELVCANLGGDEHRERLFVILGELYNNAVDHGLLRIRSRKTSADGFERYYKERAESLARLEGGSVGLAIRCLADPDGGRSLRVAVEDSGSGFDFQDLPPELEDNHGLSGRGIRVVRALCRELTYRGRGNRVEAVYGLEDAG